MGVSTELTSRNSKVIIMNEELATETPRRIIGQRSDYWDSILSQEIGDRFTEYRSKWKKVSNRELVTEYPLYIQIEHIGKCNLRCASCIQGIDDLRDSYSKGFPVLDMASFKNIVNEAKEFDCPSMSFHNNDEPLLVKDMESRIELAKEKGFVDLILVTNATLLTPERSERLLKSGITKINFSLDACDESVYRKVRIGGDFNQVLHNIEYFMSLRQSLGLRIPITRATCVVSKYCSDHVDEFRRFWEKRVDIVEFQNFQALEGYTESLKPEGAVVDQSFVCNAPWQQVVVRPNGNILPCCSFYGAELVLGNINCTSIYDVWNGRWMKTIRDRLLRNDYSNLPACKKCSESFYLSS